MEVQLTFPVQVPSAVKSPQPYNLMCLSNCVPFNAFDITTAVLCPFLTQGLHFRMCDMRDASTLNFKYLCRTTHFQKRRSQTGSWLARCCPLGNVLMHGNLVEKNETNCRGLWHVVLNGSGIPEQIASTGTTHRYIKWNMYQLSPPQD